MSISQEDRCPCGSGQSYQACCAVIHDNPRKAVSPEQLMRARYSAYSMANIDFIEATMVSPAADGFDVASASQWAQSVTWLDLAVLDSRRMPNRPRGEVEFVARFIDADHVQVMHERSVFIKKKGRWYYQSAKPTRCAISD